MSNLSISDPSYRNEENIEKISLFFKIFSESTRLKIILYILEKPECIVNDIVNALNIAQPIVSHHLHVMESFNIIHMKREGRIKKCCVKNPDKIKKIIELSKDFISK